MNGYLGTNVNDYKFMEYAYLISKHNPDSVTNQAVGAVLVKDGQIISSGNRQIYINHCNKLHKCIHAEHMAIMEAGILNCKDATLYVTMEPCTKRWHNSVSWHYPPCCELIVRNLIERVVIGSFDARFGTGGHKYLEENGVKVEFLLDFEEDIKRLNENVKVHKSVENEYDKFIKSEIKSLGDIVDKYGQNIR